ncbi:MAG TPA: glycosyl hydrolase family 8 [bacterium]|nr:glycosyl hydrolase family 8 [bacterium]
MRPRHLLYGLLTVILLAATSLLAYPATVSSEKAEMLAKRFVLERLAGEDGAIYASGKVRRLLLFPTYDPDDLLASGVLSETAGLAMQYAVAAGDQRLFDQQLNYIKKKMLGQFGLFYWKISYNGDLVAGTSASVDDLRIIGAALAAHRKWGAISYKQFALDIAENVLQYEVVDGHLRDFLNWRDYGRPTVAETLRLSYADMLTLAALAAEDERWAPVHASTGKLLLGAQRESGLYYERYDFTAGQYESLRQNMINQLYCALFALPIEGDTHRFADWMRDRLKEDGVLYAEYDSTTGEPTQFFESTSVYALAARYARLAGDREMGDRLLRKLQGFQNLNPLSPMYGGFSDDEVYSFDNLEALITLRLFNAGE